MSQRPITRARSTQSTVPDENGAVAASKKTVVQTQAQPKPFADRTNHAASSLAPRPAALGIKKPGIAKKPVVTKPLGRTQNPRSKSFTATNALLASKPAASVPGRQPHAFQSSFAETSFDGMDLDEEQAEMDVTEAPQWEDVDAPDAGDPQCVTEYVEDIYEHCREREIKYRISPDYVSKQIDINEKMRAILVDWMIEVHLKFKLLPETMYLAVHIIDRFLTLKCVAREQLQLVGVTSMFIASKYEEIYPPECNDFVFISANAYTKEQVLSMEQCILNTLSFQLSAPTTLYFLRRFSKAARSDYRIHTLSKFLTEMALVELQMLKYLPSQVAAAAVYLARHMTLQDYAWNATLQHYSKYDEAALAACVVDLNGCLKRAHENANLQAVIRKYANRKYGEVAKIAIRDISYNDMMKGY